MPLFTSGGLGRGLGLVSSGLGLGLGLKNLVLFTSLAICIILLGFAQIVESELSEAIVKIQQ